MNDRERIAITGASLVTPLGYGVAGNWERCRTGNSGISEFRSLEGLRHGCRSLAAVPAYEPRPLRAPKNEKFMNPGARHLIQAGLDALAGAAIETSAMDPFRVAVYVGSGRVGPEPEEFFRAFEVAKTPDGQGDWDQIGGRASRLLDSNFPLRSLSNSAAALLAMEICARGPSNNFVQSDVASALALGAACRDLVEDRCDVAIAGGADCLIVPASYLNFAAQGLLSVKAPEEAFRPFDRDADGLVLGEGAAAVVLERLSDARARNAPLLGEVAGFATATGSAESIGPFAGIPAVAEAVAGATASGIPDFVVASGFSLPDADRKEAALLSEILGNGVPVTAFKSLTGYLGAATALVEIVLGVLALNHRLIPPVAHHSHKAEGLDLRIVSDLMPLSQRGPAAALFLSNSWTGQSAAVLIRTLA